MMAGAARGALAAGLLLLGLIPGRANPRAFERPPYAGAYEPQGVDERGLWMDLDEYERWLRRSPNLLDDPGLSAFVRRVLCDTLGQDRCAALRLYLLQDASFNATMTPNGILVVHTGLLARLHSEAELAAVLGHEFAHFELRHSLRSFLRQRRATDWSSWIALAGVALAVNTGTVQRELVVGGYAFSRAQETEADLVGGRLVQGSRFRLTASAVWQRVIEEEDALRAARRLAKVNHFQSAWYEDHPATGARMRYMAEEEAAAGQHGDEGKDTYRLATAPALRVLFEPLVKGNDFAVADYVIRSRGEALGWDGALLTLRGELFRLRGHPRDLVTARDLFTRAIATAETPAEAWRGLGLTQLKLGDPTGRAALATYLARRPAATDVAFISMLLEN